MLPRILILQLISSYQLNDLMNRFFNHWKLHLPTTAKQMIQWAKVSIFKLGQFCVNIYLFIRKFSFCFIFLFYIFIYLISSTLHISVYLVMVSRVHIFLCNKKKPCRRVAKFITSNLAIELQYSVGFLNSLGCKRLRAQTLSSSLKFVVFNKSRAWYYHIFKLGRKFKYFKEVDVMVQQNIVADTMKLLEQQKSRK